MARAVGLALLLLVVAARPATASCAGPELTLDRTTFAPGEVVEIHGRFFGTECFDQDPHDGPALGPPQRDIRLAFAQGERTFPIIRVDATRGHAFRIAAAAPAGLAPGGATVTSVGEPYGAPPVPVTIEGRARPSPSPRPTILLAAGVGDEGGVPVLVLLGVVAAILAGGALLLLER